MYDGIFIIWHIPLQQYCIIDYVQTLNWYKYISGFKSVSDSNVSRMSNSFLKLLLKHLQLQWWLILEIAELEKSCHRYRHQSTIILSASVAVSIVIKRVAVPYASVNIIRNGPSGNRNSVLSIFCNQWSNFHKRRKG